MNGILLREVVAGSGCGCGAARQQEQRAGVALLEREIGDIGALDYMSLGGIGVSGRLQLPHAKSGALHVQKNLSRGTVQLECGGDRDRYAR